MILQGTTHHIRLSDIVNERRAVRFVVNYSGGRFVVNMEIWSVGWDDGWYADNIITVKTKTFEARSK